jgi:hypothetical protein
MLAEVTGMQLYYMQIARLASDGRLTETISGLAKLNNTAQGTPDHCRGARPAGRQRDPAR